MTWLPRGSRCPNGDDDDGTEPTRNTADDGDGGADDAHNGDVGDGDDCELIKLQLVARMS